MTTTTITETETNNVLGYTRNAIQKLNESRSLLDQYVQHQKSKIDDLRQRNQLVHAQETEKIQSSLKVLKTIQRQRGVVDDGTDVDGDGDGDGGKEDRYLDGIVQQKESLAERQMEVERQLANLHLEKKTVQKSLQLTSQQEKVIFTKAEQVRKSKERIEKANQVTVEELTIAVCKYRELGLDFIKGENGALLFNFTKIDERDCDRIFSFRLLITEGDQYLVQDCCPMLREEVVMRLVHELNRTEDYPSFMRGIRNAFKDYVADEGEEGDLETN